MKNLLSTQMGQTLICAFLFSILAPFILILLNGNKIIQRNKHTATFLYIIIILVLTIINRNVGENRIIRITPFWTYSLVSIPQYRWEIYLNVLLFIPLGFLLGWAYDLNFPRTICIAFILSISIEIVQYFYQLGVSEVDDIIHNTLGTAIGFWYFILLIHVVPSANNQEIGDCGLKEKRTKQQELSIKKEN